MNPGINATTDSEEVMLLQQALLWMLYDAGHLDKYPMAIGEYSMQNELCSTATLIMFPISGILCACLPTCIYILWNDTQINKYNSTCGNLFLMVYALLQCIT